MSSCTTPVIVKKYAAQAGLDSEKVAGHSLRAGCATYMLDKGVPAHIVQKHMRHKSFDTT
ncbi:tyrosine-type recombinase/integrase [bacterium]|nr:tyrosine-type recombinase/integrase [bacterium]